MGNKKLKIILGAMASVTLITFIALFFVVKSKVNSEEIRKVAIEEIQKVFPNAKVQLGKLELGIGTSVSLTADQFAISQFFNKKEHDLLKVKDLKVRIPILSILTGGGAIDVIMDSPHINYLEMKDNNIWAVAMKEKKGKKKKGKTSPRPVENKKGAESPGAEVLVVPAFIANSTVNLKLTDILVKYRLASSQRGEVRISKFLVKQLGLESPAAYEIASKMDLNLDKTEKASFETLIIGGFNLKNFLEKGQVSSKVHIKLSDFNFTKMPFIVPDITSDINLDIFKTGAVNGKVKTEFKDSSLNLDFTLSGSRIEIKNIKTALLFSDIVGILNDKTMPVSGNKTKIFLSGGLKINDGKLFPALNFDVNPGISIKANDQVMIATAKGNYSGKNISLSSNIKAFGGDIVAKLKTVFDLNSKQTALHKRIPSYNVNVDLIGLNLPKEFLQKTIYGGGKKAEPKKNDAPAATGSAPAKAAAASAVIPLLPKGKINVSLKNINIGGEKFNGDTYIATTATKVKTPRLNFTLGNGKGSFNQETTLSKSKVATKFGLKLTALNLASFNSLLPPGVSEVKGICNGTVSGNVSTGKVLTYRVPVKLDCKDGELKGVDIKDYIQGIYAMAKKIPKVGDKIDPNKSVDIDGNFETLNLKGNFAHNDYNLEKFYFVGLKKKIDLKAHGHIYPTGKEGRVFVDLKDQIAISKNLKKHAGTDTLPLLLKGPGFTLKPDYGFTTKKLAKSAVKKHKKKVIKKVEKKAKDKVKELLKGKGKKFLKGIF